MIGRGNDDGIQAVGLFFQHSPIVPVARGIRKDLGRLVQEVAIHIAQRHHVLAGELLHVVPSFVAAADDAQVQLLVGRF